MEYIILFVIFVWIAVKRPELAYFLNKAFFAGASFLIFYIMATTSRDNFGTFFGLECALVAFYFFAKKVISLLRAD